MTEIRLDEHTINTIATQFCDAADKRIKPLLRLVEKIEEHTARTALSQKEWLTLNEVAWSLGSCDTYLRNSGFLNDLRKRAHVPNKLNGFRLSRSRNAQWRFRRAEFRRFGPRFHGASGAHQEVMEDLAGAPSSPNQAK